eukprot:scaffold5668_cov111-Isochrysis_galbana.AAC.11
MTLDVLRATWLEYVPRRSDFLATTSWPRRSRPICLSSEAMSRASAVFPVPGLPRKTMCRQPRLETNFESLAQRCASISRRSSSRERCAFTESRPTIDERVACSAKRASPKSGGRRRRPRSRVRGNGRGVGRSVVRRGRRWNRLRSRRAMRRGDGR